jgi:uroporphyrinogen-III synthase
VITCLRSLELRGRRVGMQLYGTEPNLPLQDYLRKAGASALIVAPYVYGEGVTHEAIRGLINELADGRVDAIAFTSKQQIERLFRALPAETVRAALARTAVAAVGPVVAQTLSDYGVAVQAMPGESWFMKPLTAELEALLGDRKTSGVRDIG